MSAGSRRPPPAPTRAISAHPSRRRAQRGARRVRRRGGGKGSKGLAVKGEDAHGRAPNRTRDGPIVHPSFGGGTAPAAPAQTASQPEVARADGAGTTTGTPPSTADAVTL